MTGSAPAAPSPAAAHTGLGDRAIKFQIKTGSARWACTLQDRSTYERSKATRSNSSASIASSSSSTMSQ